MRLGYELCSRWPPLAWVARIGRGASTIVIHHGSGVELADDWFCEAVWDGPFAEGGFDQTDIVAGTGGRLRDGTLAFVSSGSTVDRLQWIERDDQVLVSNTLAGLLRACGEELDPSYRHYHRDLFSIVWGLRRYARHLPASGGSVALCYFDNLRWDGHRCRHVSKPWGERRFGGYSQYVDFLRRSMHSIAENMTSSERGRPYAFLGSLSTGYDSTTVTALAADAGLRDVLCFARGGERDRGSRIAHYFGVNAIEVGIDDWRNEETSEIPFVAGDCFGEEVHYAAARERMAGKVFLSGTYGGKIWGLDNLYPNADIMRSDPQGGALTEFRLHAGFIHCAVPFWGVRDAASILSISRSEELQPWDVGGGYSRPICRRIVESAGVPREAFGQQKSFAARWIATAPEVVSGASRRALVEWLGNHRASWWRKGRLPPLTSVALERAQLQLSWSLSTLLNGLPGARRLGLHKMPITGPIMNLDMSMPHHPPAVFGARRYTFPWAVGQVSRAYPQPD